jgi:hypothetical protein
MPGSLAHGAEWGLYWWLPVWRYLACWALDARDKHSNPKDAIMQGQRHLIQGLTALVLCAWAPMANAQVDWVRDPANPVLAPGAPGSWDESFAIATTVMFHQGIYKMWYEGDGGFGYATSADGLAWSKHGSNPVLVPGSAGSWDEVEIGHASVVYEDAMYRMWYGGEDTDGAHAFGYATSPDGVVWTKYPGNPVLDPAPAGSMDDVEMLHPSVIFDTGLYRMWYAGQHEVTQRILYASSPDGINWTRFTAHPMLEPGPSGSWDGGSLGSLCVVADGAFYHMWYTGWNEFDDLAIGYAWSTDGLTWTKNTDYNPVLTPGTAGSWDDLLIALPVVLLEGDGFRMWYAGTNDDVLYQNGLATSPSVTDVRRDPSGSPGGVGLSTLYQNAPNPFRSSTIIRYEVAAPTPVRLEIIDLTGRLVRRLIGSEDIEAGLHMLRWDGCDDSGRKVAAGLYFCRLETTGVVRSRRMILIR